MEIEWLIFNCHACHAVTPGELVETRGLDPMLPW